MELPRYSPTTDNPPITLEQTTSSGKTHHSIKNLKTKTSLPSRLVSLIQMLFSDTFSSLINTFNKKKNEPINLRDRIQNAPVRCTHFEANEKNSIIYNPATKTFTLITEAPPIKNLVISGGGAKGVILPGVLLAFEQHKTEEISFREQIDHIAGSSVGAVMGGLIAAGMPAKELIEIMAGKETSNNTEETESEIMEAGVDVVENDIGSAEIQSVSYGIENKPEAFDDIKNNNEGLDFEALLGSGRLPVNLSGEPLLKFMRDNLGTSIENNLKRLFTGTPNSTAVLEGNVRDYVKDSVKDSIRQYIESQGREVEEDDLLIDEITASTENLLKELDKEEGSCRITFSMLENLHKLEPKIFKSLTVTATCREDGRTYYFDAAKTPNLEIATACRASASLPLILKPVTINKNDLEGYPDLPSGLGDLTFVDGGYFDNISVSSVADKQGKIDETMKNRGENGQNLQTLALVFDSEELAPLLDKNGNPVLDGKGKPMTEESKFFKHKIEKHALYDSSSPVERFVRDFIPRHFGGIQTKKKNTEAKEKGLIEVQENYTQRNIPLAIPLKTGDFKKSREGAKKFIKLGVEQAQDYLANHEGEQIAYKFHSQEQLLKAIPQDIREDDKFQAFLDGLQP